MSGTLSSAQLMASAGTQTSPVQQTLSSKIPVSTATSSTATVAVAAAAAAGVVSSLVPTIAVEGYGGGGGGGLTLSSLPPIDSQVAAITPTPSPAQQLSSSTSSSSSLAVQVSTPASSVGGSSTSTLVGASGGCGGSSSSSPPKPKRSGSLALFYRRLYQLAYMRIKDLCERLGLAQDIQQKVWTCFEHIMITSPDLMRERHLDQVIMCCVYVLSKVARLDITFQEIMRQYRHQPQSKNHVYRNVLLNNGPRKAPVPDSNSSPPPAEDGSNNMDIEEGSSCADQPQRLTPKDHLLYPQDIPLNKRGDIIEFYNKIFIGLVKDYVLRFSPQNDADNPALSPLPDIRRSTPSPRRLSKHHNIYVSPYKGSALDLSPSTLGKVYTVGKSPAADLHSISKAIGWASRKRPLDTLLAASPDLTATSPAAKRLHTAIAGVVSSSSSSPLLHRQQQQQQNQHQNLMLQQLMNVVSDRENMRSAASASSTTSTGASAIGGGGGGSGNILQQLPIVKTHPPPPSSSSLSQNQNPPPHSSQ